MSGRQPWLTATRVGRPARVPPIVDVFGRSPYLGRVAQFNTRRDWRYTASDTTTGGTSIAMTGFPEHCQEIYGWLDTVSTNTDNTTLIVQIGDAGDLETSGYGGYATAIAGASAAVASTANSAGFNITDALSYDNATSLTGWFHIRHVGGNRWLFMSSASNGGNAFFAGAGSKTLSDLLTRLALTTAGGTATFDTVTGFNVWAR